LGFNGDLYPTAGASVVMTTKGDMVDYDTERQRLGIGSTGQVLTVASSLPTWATLTTADSVLTTQGDVLFEGASGLERLGQSTDGYVLTTKGAGADPEWAEVSAGATLTDKSITGATDGQSTSSTSDTNMIGSSSVTLSNITGGKAYCTLFANTENNTTNSVNYVSLWDEETTGLVGLQRRETSAGAYHTDTCSIVVDTDSTTLQMRWHVNQGTAGLFNSTLAGSKTAILEIS